MLNLGFAIFSMVPNKQLDLMDDDDDDDYTPTSAAQDKEWEMQPQTPRTPFTPPDTSPAHARPDIAAAIPSCRCGPNSPEQLLRVAVIRRGPTGRLVGNAPCSRSASSRGLMRFPSFAFLIVHFP